LSLGLRPIPNWAAYVALPINPQAALGSLHIREGGKAKRRGGEAKKGEGKEREEK